MLQAVWTELAGWREALTEPSVLVTIIWRLLGAGFIVMAGILGASQPGVTVAGVVLVVLAFCLIRLRLYGQP